MSSKTKLIFERGKYFIESSDGSKSFKKFIVIVSDSGSFKNIIKYIPTIIINRIINMINSGDKDTAVVLWMRACEIAEHTPSKIRRNIFINMLIITLIISVFFNIIY